MFYWQLNCSGGLSIKHSPWWEDLMLDLQSNSRVLSVFLGKHLTKKCFSKNTWNRSLWIKLVIIQFQDGNPRLLSWNHRVPWDEVVAVVTVYAVVVSSSVTMSLPPLNRMIRINFNNSSAGYMWQANSEIHAHNLLCIICCQVLNRKGFQLNYMLISHFWNIFLYLVLKEKQLIKVKQYWLG